MDQLGHFLRPVSRAKALNDDLTGRLKCMHCHQVWGRSDLRRAVDEGSPCPLLDYWNVRSVTPDRPILGRLGVAPVVGGHQLHISHRLMYLRGIIYCGTCGCFTDGTRVQKLTRPCLADGVVQQTALKRLRRGVHPKGPSATWPVRRIERYEIEHYLDITEGA